MVRFAPPIGVVAHTANRFVTVGYTANPGRPAKNIGTKSHARAADCRDDPGTGPAARRSGGAAPGRRDGGDRVLPVLVRAGQPAGGAARWCGIGDRRVDVVLGQVGLAERAGDAVAGYSYGMRQRLGGSDQIQ